MRVWYSGQHFYPYQGQIERLENLVITFFGFLRLYVFRCFFLHAYLMNPGVLIVSIILISILFSLYEMGIFIVAWEKEPFF